MGYPQGENSDPFDASKRDEPYGGSEQYPPYRDPNAQPQNPTYQNPTYQNPQYQNPSYQNPQYSQYGNAPYAGGYQVPAPTNTLAIVSLVLAILGLTFLPLIASVCAVVCGHISRGQIKRTGEGGSGFATAGLVVGYVSIAVFVIIVAAIVIFAIAASNSSTY
ncbi:DUF4190 domain-containing protein [Rhodococcus sp. IEGM 1401]|uniref:DUF4190 domain-containing protein n=1 Tax=unclassified Rhodococcus (in: high G+C Gram-positive bacteria) TaxID=192944 RepID=UPI0022B39914|nr:MULTISPECIES: DUF4190 domain-containing protein [unclassified Rhodococcus (in: high G+C Gram-positive bacteria)]MCZ4563452.1 DUF4190 domain-containing protein [Rhodococcus sp. IEGM 1401]MDI9923575.1 DUF4190 domain-containing protein [Rhodococcus sp. IEGM 1372]MDV8036090.1 DUF4190 domain-containing protein [Rhodococcus sp. IEGM 1414]